ncbi:MAG TPA: SDR family oxidoreductase [Paracoccaceae bacterium]|nr:SDR family oxidoreductase [Paracoccaceae bacterium]
MSSPVAIVTGAGRGIGREFARLLSGAGWRLTITAARSREELEATASALPGEALPLVADAGDPVDAERTVAETLARFGRLDALVNNAGRGPREWSETFNRTPERFWEIPPDAWREIVRSNVDGPFLMARFAAPAMIAAGRGRIVNVSTSRITMVRKGYSPYGPTKAALDAMTRVFAQDLEGTGVTVNALLPGGATDTPFIPGERGRTGADGKLLPVSVMNEALLWLLSEASDGVTAARLVGARWDPADPAACREDTGEPPLIL